MSKDFYLEFARNLWQAYKDRKSMEPLTNKRDDLTIDDAYQIQLLTVEMAKKDGRKVVGKKIGLTSKAMQEQFGIDTPDYGHVYDNMMYDQHEKQDINVFYKPKIETEIAFILKEDIQGPGVTLSDVIMATEGVMPCFEIIDSRITNWNIEIVDSISDNASAAGVILGDRMYSLSEVSINNMGMVLYKNGERIYTASSAAVMGNPAMAVVWLANKLGEYGVGLKKGEIILSGSLAPAYDFKENDYFIAEFDGIGKVQAKY